MPRETRKKLLLSLSLFLIFMLSISAPALAETPPYKPSYNYVALGDSLAAGQNPYGAENGYSYTNYVSNFLSRTGAGGSYDNFGESGMTSRELLDMLDPSDGDVNGKMIRKLRSGGEDAVVTINIGANDFLPYVIDLFSPLYLPDVDTTPAMLQSILAGTVSNAVSILTMVRYYNPEATVLVMGYYNALVNYASELDPTGQLNGQIEGILMQINGQLAGSTSYYGGIFVNTQGIVIPEMLPGDIHPTRDGYRAIGKAFTEMIRLVTGIN